jgi:hypothetical protein
MVGAEAFVNVREEKIFAPCKRCSEGWLGWLGRFGVAHDWSMASL